MAVRGACCLSMRTFLPLSYNSSFALLSEGFPFHRIRWCSSISSSRSCNQIPMCSLEKREQVFVLTLTGDGEHRLDGELIASIRSALARIRSESSSSSSGGGRERGGCGALVTVAEGRFFSNGFDLAWANSAPSPSAARKRLDSLVALFRPVVADLLSLPMPTIAAVTGHAAAAGLMLALSHDYVTMRGDRGFLYMSELDI